MLEEEMLFSALLPQSPDGIETVGRAELIVLLVTLTLSI